MEKLSSKTKNLNFFRVPFAAQAGPGAAEKLSSQKKINFFGVPFAAPAGPGAAEKLSSKKKELNFFRVPFAARARLPQRKFLRQNFAQNPWF